MSVKIDKDRLSNKERVSNNNRNMTSSLCMTDHAVAELFGEKSCVQRVILESLLLGSCNV